jgi:hypothetical protein
MLQFHRGANVRIEHPFRDFEDRETVLVISPAAENKRTAPNAGCSHKHPLPVPGMEPVANFLNIGNMGFSLPGCTMTNGPTAV